MREILVYMRTSREETSTQTSPLDVIMASIVPLSIATSNVSFSKDSCRTSISIPGRQMEQLVRELALDDVQSLKAYIPSQAVRPYVALASDQ